MQIPDNDLLLSVGNRTEPRVITRNGREVSFIECDWSAIGCWLETNVNRNMMRKIRMLDIITNHISGRKPTSCNMFDENILTSDLIANKNMIPD